MELFFGRFGNTTVKHNTEKKNLQLNLKVDYKSNSCLLLRRPPPVSNPRIKN